MTSPYPSLACFDDDGTPVYDDEPRTKQELAFVKNIHKAIVGYFTEYITDLWIEGVDIRRDVPDLIYHFRQPEFTKMTRRLFKPVKSFDDMILKQVE